MTCAGLGDGDGQVRGKSRQAHSAVKVKKMQDHLMLQKLWSSGRILRRWLL